MSDFALPVVLGIIGAIGALLSVLATWLQARRKSAEMHIRSQGHRIDIKAEGLSTDELKKAVIKWASSAEQRNSLDFSEEESPPRS
jgi:hypothetical protein